MLLIKFLVTRISKRKYLLLALEGGRSTSLPLPPKFMAAIKINILLQGDNNVSDVGESPAESPRWKIAALRLCTA